MRIIEAKNPGAFYKHVNKRIKHRSVIPTLISSNGLIVTSDENKANAFNEYFASVGVTDDGSTPTLIQCEPRPLLEMVVFDEYGVSRAVLNLKANLSAGPDGLPPLLFKRLRFSIAKPLAILYTQLFSVGFVPESWKNAIIVPDFKKGTSSNVANYRLISLTCIASKLMERIIATHIHDYFHKNHLLSDVQHGFIRGHYTCTNMFKSMNDWTLSVKSKSGISVAYIDYSRAFDSVTYAKLFARLQLWHLW